MTLGCGSLKNLREGHGLSVSSSLQKIKLRGKKSLLCSLQISPVCSVLQEAFCTFRKSFTKEKIDDHYSGHLSKILLYVDQSVCNTLLPFAPFENFSAACFSPQLLHCPSSQTTAYLLCISVHIGFHRKPQAGVSYSVLFPRNQIQLCLHC